MTEKYAEYPFLLQAVELARDRFTAYNSKAGEVTANVIENKYGLLAPWVAMILVSGPEIRITFKVHFALTQAIAIVIDPTAPPVNVNDTERMKSLSFDFMKEYCNLYAGSMKRVLGDVGLETGISLPMLTRGFDEIYFPKGDFIKTFDIFWQLNSALGSFVCSLYVEATKPEEFKKINIKFDSSEEGEIDFL